MMVTMRPLESSELAFVLAIEERPANRPFINCWPLDRHRKSLADPDFAYRLFEEGSQPIGYAILTGLRSGHRSIQLMRLALDRPGGGLGRICCQLLLNEAFDELAAHRMHLDLFEDNSRAYRLYKSLGFRREGVLRDADLGDRGFRSLIVMSILESEYRVTNADRI